MLPFDCPLLILYILQPEPGDRVEVDEPIAQIETDKVLTKFIVCILQWSFSSIPFRLAVLTWFVFIRSPLMSIVLKQESSKRLISTILLSS